MNTNERKMKRMRTLDAGYREIKAVDPDTNLTRHGLRQALLSGIVPSVQIGTKRLFDVDTVWDYLTAAPQVPTPKASQMRSISNT